MRALHRFAVVPALRGSPLCSLPPCPAAAQGFGVGGRFAFVKADTEGDDDSRRFIGGHIRLPASAPASRCRSIATPRSFDALDQRVKETPVQASLLLFLARGSFKPYLLGGPGWYNERGSNRSTTATRARTTKEFGWHGGFGAEIRGRPPLRRPCRLPLHLPRFHDDDDDGDDDGLIGGLLPSHEGSMWTVGATIYF